MTHIDHEAASEAVQKGMAEWDRVKRLSLEAIDRANAAEKRATTAEARAEILGTQNKTLAEENIRLRSQVEDAKVGLAAAMAALLAARDNVNTGDYRAAGSLKLDAADKAGLQGVAQELDGHKPIPKFLQGNQGQSK